jgi:two-component system, chemotaxis family, response regulator Rcp1
MNRTIEILMIEDNEGDVFLTREAFKSAKIANSLSIVRNGTEAMEFLHRKGKYADAVFPDLILLDLNLPGMDGREILAKIREDPALTMIPVVVLTSSKAEQDIVKAYKLHANCYIVKPVDFECLMEVVAAIESFWLAIVKLPPHLDS